ncbi:MAG: glycosyltransferase [Deltaproteobacteria bacterium]|nr:glycosyltransferase [Deltaproteobacteria bacterium]MBW2081919.1 glycosyltransferase [Deltaproteobacteria bacterium]
MQLRKGEKINVLHVVLGLQTGGLERVVLDLITHSSDDIKMHLVCLDEIWDNEDLLIDKCVPWSELHNYGRHKLRTIYSLVRFIYRYQINLIHTHNPGPHFYGSIAGRITGIPVVHTKHGRNYQKPYNRFWLNRISGFLSNKIICVSKDVKKVAVNIDKFPAHKLVTIINGVEVNRFAGVFMDRTKYLGINADIVIGNVGRIAWEKDHKTLLEAFSLLKRWGRECHLLIVGDGPMKDECVLLAESMGIQENVSFVGNRKDVPQLLACMDIFALSSVSEGTPLTLLEAMAAELPVVCTSVGGNADIVVDGVTGLVVPARDPYSLAKSLDMLILDKTMRVTMGGKGSERVRKEFSIKKTVNEYEALYKEILSQGSIVQKRSK